MIVDNRDRKNSSWRWAVGRSPADQLPAIGDAPLFAFCLLPTADCQLPTGRPGATLLEVLVAIFIMGIGLMALLVLFPLGALSMARAIQDERAAQAGAAASAVANIKDIRRDLVVYNPSGVSGAAYDYFYNPQNGNPFNADLEKKSWPILVDPVGFRTAAGLPAQQNVAGVAGLLRRTSASFITGNTDVYRWFTFQDDLIYDKFGNAQSVGAIGTIERDVRYSTAYLLQRPRAGDPSVVECAVIVYSGRPLGLSGNLDLAEFGYDGGNTTNVGFDPSANMIRVNYSAMGMAAPPIRPGDWVLDVSIVRLDPLASNGEPHGYFYRVAGINDNGAFMDIEVQQNLRGFPANGFLGPATTGAASDRARLLFLEGVAEVFERGPGKEPSTAP
jgi:hypothetical protein